MREEARGETIEEEAEMIFIISKRPDLETKEERDGTIVHEVTQNLLKS